MVKGAISLLVIGLFLWFIWMTYEWLRKPRVTKKRRK